MAGSRKNVSLSLTRRRVGKYSVEKGMLVPWTGLMIQRDKDWYVRLRGRIGHRKTR